MSSKTPLNFVTHADLKNVIGQDLINDDNIAIIELVKNGIDAGARKVEVEFMDDPSCILVVDNGSGMLREDLTSKWLNIAYSEKKDKKIKDRQLAGNKGVGRFACDRLGRRLDLYTRKKGGELLHLEVDWTKFEGRKESDAYIQKVKVYLSSITDDLFEIALKKPFPRTGTVILISGLHQDWDREKLIGLRRYLERFVNPLTAFDAQGVSIELKAEREENQDTYEEPHHRVNGQVENKIFSKLKFNTTYIQANIDRDGKHIRTELFHDGRSVYKIVEKNSEHKLLKDVSVVIHYMNPYKKAYFKRQTGLHLVEFGSIFLFINGYRVPPYGDRDNDWLQLDNRKTQGTSRFLGNRELLGLVNINDPEREFRIVSNREGVARDLRFHQLTDKPTGFFIRTLARLEKFVVDGLGWDRVPDDIRTKIRGGISPFEQSIEIYDESLDKKIRRVALDIFKIIGVDEKNTKELHINPDILDSLSREREEEVALILEKFDLYGGAVGGDVKSALRRIRGEFQRQKESLSRAREQISEKSSEIEKLTKTVDEVVQQKSQLETRVKTQESEILFSRLSSGTSHDQLMLLHHHSNIAAVSASNFLEKVIIDLSSNASPEKIIGIAEKALNNVKKIIAITNMATKANFKLRTETITADLAAFIQEYLENVAPDTSAGGLRVTASRDPDVNFEMRFRPIDIAIVFDNLASNSLRAGAKKLAAHIYKGNENELFVDVSDDGSGLDSTINPGEGIFERGVTTTKGSGLGLYHVKNTIASMGGDVFLVSHEGRGLMLRIRILK